LSSSFPVVTQLAERLAKPYVERVKYPSLSANENFEDAMRELIAGELRALEASFSRVIFHPARFQLVNSLPDLRNQGKPGISTRDLEIGSRV
jgi:hypothetical protein